MDIQNAAAGAADWACPKCSQSNAASDRFCRSCGFQTGMVIRETDESASRGKFRLILILVLTFGILAGAAAGAYFWRAGKEKKIAKEYLDSQGDIFFENISLINALSTEKALEDQENNNDLFLKKLEEEKGKAEKSLSDIQSVRKKNEEARSNDLVSGVDSMLKQYYSDGERDLKTYSEYLGYRSEMAKEQDSFEKEMEKIQTIFRSSQSDEDAKNSLRALSSALSDSSGRFRKITPPTGLEEAQKKFIALVDRLSSIIGNMASAIEAKSLPQLTQAANDLDAFLADQKSVKDIDDLENYYFDQMHKNFVSLRQTADNIKTEFIKEGAQYKTDVRIGDIEGW